MDARRRGLTASAVKASRMSLALGLVLTLVGILHDAKTAPQWAHQFMLLRFAVAGLAAVILALMYTQRGTRYVNWLLFGWTPVPQTMLAYMIICTGGAASPYSQGLIFCIVIVTLFPLLSFRQSLILVCYTLAIYIASLFLGKMYFPPSAYHPPVTSWMHVVTMIVVCGFARVLLDSSFKELVNYEHDLSDKLDELERQHNDLAHHKALAFHEEKMQSLSSVVSSILHQINHPASTALLALDSAMRKAQTHAPDLVQPLMDVHAALTKINTVSSTWRRLTPQRDANLEEMTKVEDVGRLVWMALQLLADKSSGIAVDMHIEPDSYVRCDQAALVNVLQYIIENAIDAVRRSDSHDQRIWISASHVDGAVNIEIMDNGAGIPPQLQAEIFLPFFSTDASGKRLGLGLSTAYTEITRHGGTITVSSIPDAKTTFTIRLPHATRDFVKA